jgi:NADH-quinone oxidoreductase subunit A
MGISDYIPVVILFFCALLLGAGLVVLSAILRPKKRGKTELNPYECGIEQANTFRQPISVKYFIMAIIFILFDVEVALLYPWAVVFRNFVSRGMRGFFIVEGFIFIGVLAVAMIYILRNNLLEWEK